MSVELSLTKIVPFTTSGNLSVASNGEVLLVWDRTTVWRSTDASLGTGPDFTQSQSYDRAVVFGSTPTAVALSKGGNSTSLA